MTLTVPTADGRTLEVRVTGPDAGLPLVMQMDRVLDDLLDQAGRTSSLTPGSEA